MTSQTADSNHQVTSKVITSSSSKTTISQSSKTSNNNKSSLFEVASNLNSSNIENSKDKSKKSNKNNNNHDEHQPYLTSLVNTGFGFGFDLHGGDADNQLTFIVNVHPSGDAARKGLSDGMYFFSQISNAEPK